jgi:hypothetical protein
VSIETHVDGDPGACRRSARRLAALADAAEVAGTSLARRSTLSVADFDGMSGDAFRAHARDLSHRLEDDARRCRRLSRAMGHLADDLDALVGLMGQVRDRAREGGLRVEGETVREPDPSAPAVTHDVWRELVPFVGDLRSFEARSQRAWEEALLGETAGGGSHRPDDPAPPDRNPVPASGTSGPPEEPDRPPRTPPARGEWCAEEVGERPWRVGFEEVSDAPR